MNEFDRILVEQGISLLPRVDGTKEPPAGFRYSDRWEGKKIANLEETSSWKVHDRAAICGVNHLVVFDFDSMPSYERFWDKRLAQDLPNETLSIRTSRGVQIWFFDFSLELAKLQNVIDAKPTLQMEIFLQKHLAAVPNNTHPSGKKYQLLGSVTIARKDGIVSRAIERLRSLHWVGTIYSDSEITPFKTGNLTEQITDMEEFSTSMAKYWKPGYRNKLILALSGYLIRKNICEDSAVALINAIINKTGDNAARQSAISKIRYQYRNRDRIKRLQGLKSLARVALEVEQACQT